LHIFHRQLHPMPKQTQKRAVYCKAGFLLLR